jgi:hypothetical protein
MLQTAPVMMNEAATRKSSRLGRHCSTRKTIQNPAKATTMPSKVASATTSGTTVASASVE